MSELNFDVVIIGGGPGGYVAAIRLAQLGFNVACIERRSRLGGTCLNVGCIPSKALLESSEKFSEINHSLSQHGISVKDIKFDVTQMLTRKNQIVENLCKGIDGLFKKNKITHLKGEGSLVSANLVKVRGDQGEQLINTKKIIIATGSEIINIPNITIDEKKIVSSTGALDINKIPKKLIVIGGGYIGLELGSVWARLGSEVTVIEYLDKIVPSMDQEIGRNLYKSLENQGFKFMLSTKVISAKVNNDIVEVNIETSDGSKMLEADTILVSVGRKPHTDNLNLESVGVKLDEKKRIEVDENFKTSISDIYAIGDVIAGPMLAHKAEEEAVAVAEIIAGQAGHVNYNAIPGVIYTWPEVAAVGKTEEELKSENIEYNIGKFPFMANSRARTTSSTEGMVKILACKKTDKILGVHIIGPHAGTMIAEAVLAIEYSASSEDLARICHAHPTLNEAVKEAALAVSKRAIHI